MNYLKFNALEEEKILSNKVMEYFENELEKLGYIGKVKISEVASYT